MLCNEVRASRHLRNLSLRSSQRQRFNPCVARLPQSPKLLEFGVRSLETLGLASAIKEDLIRALFTDGVSTRDQASETSGRGVGMSALKAACDELVAESKLTRAWASGRRFAFFFRWTSLSSRRSFRH